MTRPAIVAALLTTTVVAACQSAPPAPQAGSAAPLAATGGGGGVPVAARVALDTHPVAFPQYPTVSPDGAAIVFAYAGDLWSVPAAGGTAARLTAHPSDEDRSCFSPDGRWLAFESTRDGPRNLYIMPVARGGGDGDGGALVGGTPRRVTVWDKAQSLSGFSADGKHLYFSASLEPSIYRMTRMYRVAAEALPGGSGGARVERLSDAFGGAPHAAPDGSILFNRERYDPARTKYSGAAACDVYRLEPKTGAFTRLTEDPRSDGDAFGLPDGSTVFVSSRDGENNIYRLKAGATDANPGDVRPLTRFAVAGPGIGRDQTTIMHGVRDLSVTGWTAVFCVWDTIYTLDLKDPAATPRAVPVVAGGDFAELDFLRLSAGRQLSETALSPDGKTLAVIARGEVFIRSTEKDRPTRHITATGGPGPWGRCAGLAWSPDGKTLYFSSDASGVPGIYAATVALSREDLTAEELPDRAAEPKAQEPAKEPVPADKQGDAQPEAKPESKSESGPESGPAKKPDHGKRWAEAVTFTVRPLLVSDREQRNPVPSPDGKRLLVMRDLGDLVMFDLAKLESGGDPRAAERTLVKSWIDTDPQWAADSRHIIYEALDYNFNSDIWLLDALAEGAKPVNLTRHPDMDQSPRLSADGKVLYFLSDRDADTNGRDDIFAVNLDSRLDGLRTYELADYFKEAADKARKRRPLGAPAAGPGPSPGAAGGGGGRGGRRASARPGWRGRPRGGPGRRGSAQGRGAQARGEGGREGRDEARGRGALAGETAGVRRGGCVPPRAEARRAAPQHRDDDGHARRRAGRLHRLDRRLDAAAVGGLRGAGAQDGVRRPGVGDLSLADGGARALHVRGRSAAGRGVGGAAPLRRRRAVPGPPGRRRDRASADRCAAGDRRGRAAAAEVPGGGPRDGRPLLPPDAQGPGLAGAHAAVPLDRGADPHGLGVQPRLQQPARRARGLAHGHERRPQHRGGRPAAGVPRR